MMEKAALDYEVVIVDDGSDEETRKRLAEYFERQKNVILVFSDKNEGRGGAVAKGIKASSKKYAGFIDTDLDIPARYMLELYGFIKDNGSDAVIGKRVYELGVSLYNWMRFIYSRAYFLLANAVLNMNFLDTETGIKIFDRSKVLTVLDAVEEKGWFWDTEVISRLLRSGFNVRQLPVRVVRSNKTSSVRFLRDTAAYLKALARYRGKLAKK